MSPRYKFKSTNLRAPSPPGPALRLTAVLLQRAFAVSACSCPGLLGWDLGFEQQKTQSDSVLCVLAVSESASESATCVMSFCFTTQLLPNKNGCSFGEPNLPHRPRGGGAEQHPAREDPVKGVICPWDSPAEEGRAGEGAARTRTLRPGLALSCGSRAGPSRRGVRAVPQHQGGSDRHGCG